MRNYKDWSWEEKKALIIKIVEWAQKNNKDVFYLTEEDVIEAIRYK